MGDFINLDKYKIIGEKGCSVNKKAYQLGDEIKVFCCKCSEEDKLICYDCKEKCHKGHLINYIIKMKTIDFICSCAIIGHNSNKIKQIDNQDLQMQPSNQNLKEVSCSLELYYKLLGYHDMFERKTDKSIYCVFCVYFCYNKKILKDEKILKINEEQDDFKQEQIVNDETNEEQKFFQKIENKQIELSAKSIHEELFDRVSNKDRSKSCCCNLEDSHISEDKNFSHLSKILKNPIFLKLGINPMNICHSFLNKSGSLFYEKIIKEFIRQNLEINLSIDEKNRDNKDSNEKKSMKLERIQKENAFTTEYSNISKAINALSNYFKHANIDFKIDSMKEFFSSFNIDFLIKLFSENPTENDLLIIVKRDALRIFTKFYMKPIINNCKNFNGDQIDLNVNAIHRKISSRSFTNCFYNDIDINIEKFSKFILKLRETIYVYFTYYYTTRFSKNIFKLFKEYLRILNIILKYRTDDLNFISDNVKFIDDLLKTLINKQQLNKIYLIKKHILKLLNKLQIKINDEQFYNYLDFDKTDKKNDKSTIDMSFCFENTELNNLMFNIFLMINQKKQIEKTKNQMLTQENDNFLDKMMIKEDGYINSLDLIVKNKKIIINLENFNSDLNKIDDYVKNIIVQIEFNIESISQLNNNLLKNFDYVLKYVEEIQIKFDLINSVLHNLFIDRKFKQLYLIQNFLYANGYLTKIFNTLSFIKKIHFQIPDESFIKLILLIFENLLLSTENNPFLSLLLVTNKFTKILIYNKAEYSIILFDFYHKVFKTLNKFSYKIDPIAFYNNFNKNLSKDNICKLLEEGQYEDLYYVAMLFVNLIAVCNKKNRPIVDQLTSEPTKYIFKSEKFHSDIMAVVQKLKMDVKMDYLNDHEKNIIFTYKYYLKILNLISYGHFISITSFINDDDDEKSYKLLNEIILINNVPPNLKRILITFYTKSNIQSIYSIYNSRDEVKNIFDKKSESPTNGDNRDYTSDSDLSHSEKIIDQLNNYEKNIAKHMDYFLKHQPSFFKYFAEGIFFPSVNCLYNIFYFSDRLISDSKYTVYRIVVLFCKCFLFFLNKVEEYKFYDSKLFQDYLNIDVDTGFNSQDSNYLYEQSDPTYKLSEECLKIKKKLIADLHELHNENFIIKDNNLLKKFNEYLKYYFLEKKIIINNEPIFKKLLSNNSIKKNNTNENSGNIVDPREKYINRISDFLNLYSTKKKLKNNLSFHRIFSDEQTYKNEYLNNSDSSITDYKLRNELKNNFFLLLFESIIDFDKKTEDLEDKSISSEDDYSYEFNEKNYYYLKKVVKIFKIDPDFCQNILIQDNNMIYSKKIIKEMLRKNIPSLFQLIFFEFDSIHCNNVTSPYKNLMKILEFIRLHCENHNRIFQTYICHFKLFTSVEKLEIDGIQDDEEVEKRDEEGDKKMENLFFIDYLLYNFKEIYDNVTRKLKKKETLLFFNNKEINSFETKEINFFDKLLAKIVDLLVEVYQGNHHDNYKALISDDYDFDYFLDVFLNTLDDILNITEIEIIVNNFMTFYLSLLEDYDMDDQDKNIITKKLNFKLILSTIIYCFKKCYNNFCINEKEKNNKADKNPSNFIKKYSSDKLLEVYKLNPAFSEYHLFKLMTKCFILLNILSDMKNNKAKDVLNNLKEGYLKIHNFKANPNDSNYYENIQKYEIYKFFTTIVKYVEINYTNPVTKLDHKYLDDPEIKERIPKSDSEEDITQTLKPINFLIHKDSLFLTKEDLDLFKETIPIDNYNNKLFELVSKISEVQNIIRFKKIIYSFNSKIIQFLASLNYKYFLIFSILIVLIINCIMQWTFVLIPDPKDNTKKILYSDYKNIIYYLSISNIAFTGSAIINYMIFKFLSINRQTNPGLFHFLSYLFSNEIFFLVWNLIVGIAAISDEKANFLYSLQLFSIISLFETMKTILITVKLRWKQFLTTAILIVLFIIFFTGISFYFISDYYILRDMKDMNVCSNYIHCFFIMFSYGIRMGGGIGDLIGVVYSKDELYWPLIIFQWVFYFIITLILLNVINGIIVDTFQDLREKSNKKLEIQENQCYMCSIDKIDFQINSLDFVEHNENHHNFYNYIYFMIRINEVDENMLNSIEYRTLLHCRKRQTSFFPIKEALSMKKETKSE